jgi:hypothetical protein
MEKLDALIAKLESSIEDHAIINASVSKASVGWHIEHTLLTLDLIISALSKSNPSEYKRTFDIRRTILLVFGTIPRGKIKAPKVVQPTSSIDFNTLQRHIAHTREKLKALDSLTPGHYFTHPFLGDFRLKQAIRFLQVHTNHHLSIIHDVVKSKKEA